MYYRLFRFYSDLIYSEMCYKYNYSNYMLNSLLHIVYSVYAIYSNGSMHRRL